MFVNNNKTKNKEIGSRKLLQPAKDTWKSFYDAFESREPINTSRHSNSHYANVICVQLGNLGMCRTEGRNSKNSIPSTKHTS